MLTGTKKKTTQKPRPREHEKHKAPAAEVVAFKQMKRPFSEFSDGVEQFLMDQDYSE